MKLPFLDALKKQEKKDYFLALLLRDESISAVIFEESSGKIRVVGEKEESFQDSIETASEEELLEVADKAISKSEEQLPPSIETHKTIYGVKEDWVEDAKIKKEYLGKLKKLSDTLELSPLGFIVIHEAIAHLLQEEEGAPVSAILVEVGKKDIVLCLLRAGKISETERAQIETSIAKTTDLLLRHFTSHDILPSRIIVFNGKEDEKLSQELIAHTWSKSLPFLHVPQITVLPKGFDARAVLFGAATQMGFEILKEQSIPKAESSKKTLEQESYNAKKDEIEDIKLAEKDVDFGFVQEEDVAFEKSEKKEEQEETKKDKKIAYEEHANIQDIPDSISQNGSSNQEEIKTKSLSLFMKTMRSVLSIVFLILEMIKKTISYLISVFGLSSHKKLLLIPPFILAALVIFAFFYFFGMKTTIVLTLTPNIVEDKKEITFSTTQASDLSKQIVKGETVSINEDGEISTPATGKKDVGEKAKGEITIYNSDLSQGQSFQKATAITSNNGLKFTLNDTVQIASASGDASSITSSTTKVSVTAEDIGKEFNLPSETKFTVGSTDISKVIGKNDKAFSGGSKKEVTVVAKKDLDTLEETLPKRLESKAKEDVVKKISQAKQLLPIFTKTTITKKSFTKKTGEETSTVGITGTVQYESVVYLKDELQNFSESIIKEKVKDAKIANGGITYQIGEIKKKDEGNASVILRVKAALLPNINSEDLAKRIAGKQSAEAETMLSEIPQVSSVTITPSLRIPFLPLLLPRNSGNIEISTETE